MQCIQIIVLVDPGNKCSLHMARWSKVLGDHGGWFRGHQPTNRRTRTHRTMDAAPAGAGITRWDAPGSEMHPQFFHRGQSKL